MTASVGATATRSNAASLAYTGQLSTDVTPRSGGTQPNDTPITDLLTERVEPYFSVIVPMYNRASLIRRAIDSCFASSFSDFEIIIVDDASTDESASVVDAMTGPAVRLVRHDVNRGVGAARNTGVRHARGKWLVMLDSDDELTEGALDIMHERSLEVADDVATLWFRCRTDNGLLTPQPCPPEGIWTYEDWLTFCESIIAAGKKGDSERFLVTRRCIHDTFSFAENHVLEDLFCFDVSKAYRSYFCHSVLRLYHQDADNRVTRQRRAAPDLERERRVHSARADEYTALLARHGKALAATSPRTYNWYLTRLGTTAFWCGRRREGLIACLKALQHRPLASRTLGLMIAGLLGGPVLRTARTLRGLMPRA